MTKRTKKSPAPAIQPVPLTAQRDYLLNHLQKRLRDEASHAHDDIRAWGAKLAGEKDNPTGVLLYQLQWAGKIAFCAAYGGLCEAVVLWSERYLSDGKTEFEAWVSALEYQLRAIHDDLVSDRYRGGSSSAWSNCVDDENRSARSSFYRDMKSLAESLRNVEREIDEENRHLEFQP